MEFVRFGKESHVIYTHPNFQNPQVISGKGSDELPTGTLAKIRRETGIEDLI